MLAIIAIPSYKAQTLRSNRSAGQSMLLDLAARQEVQALQKGKYATELSALVGSDHSNALHFFLQRDGKITKTFIGPSIYKIELLDASTATFQLSATALGDQANDQGCEVLTLSSNGQKGSVAKQGEAPANCWQ